MSEFKVEPWAVLAGGDIKELIQKWWGKECTDHQSRVIVQIIMHCSGLAKKTSLTRTELSAIAEQAADKALAKLNEGIQQENQKRIEELNKNLAEFWVRNV